MNILTADAALRTVLADSNEPAEIRDKSGKVMGYFLPAEYLESLLYIQAAAHFDPKEMKRRKESGEKGYTTAEVLEHLRSLEKS